MGRSVITVAVMLATFAVFTALFVGLDAASGIPVRLPVLAVGVAPRRTPTPTPRPIATTAPSATSTVATAAPTPSNAPTISATRPSATASGNFNAGAVTATPTAGGASATALPTPPGGISPPRYGTLLNYPNDTAFTIDYMQMLDERIINLTNQQRSQHGLAQLSETGALDIIAAARSQDLVQRNYFDHYDPTGALDSRGHHPAAVQELLQRDGIRYAEVGENLIGRKGFPLDLSTPSQVVQAWMSHPEHRANILHASYTEMGVGIAAQNEADGLYVVITEVFLR